MTVLDKWREVNGKYCKRCKWELSCYSPCALVQSAMMDLPCTPELERLCRYEEKREE